MRETVSLLLFGPVALGLLLLLILSLLELSEGDLRQDHVFEDHRYFFGKDFWLCFRAAMLFRVRLFAVWFTQIVGIFWLLSFNFLHTLGYERFQRKQLGFVILLFRQGLSALLKLLLDDWSNTEVARVLWVQRRILDLFFFGWLVFGGDLNWLVCWNLSRNWLERDRC